MAMNHMIFHEETNGLSAGIDVDEPTMVRQADGTRRLPTSARFRDSGRHLNISTLGDARHLGANPQGISYIFQGMRTDNEIDFLVVERIRLATANVTLDPGLLGKVFFFPALEGRAADSPVIASRLVWLGVHHIIGT